MSSVSDAATVALAGAAAVAGYTIYKNRDKIGGFFADTKDNVTNIYNYTIQQLQDAKEDVKEGAAAAGSSLSKNFTPIIEATTTNVSNIADNLKSSFSKLQSGDIAGALTGLFKSNIETPKTVVESNIQTVKSYGENAYNSIKTGIDTVVGWFKR